jgi:hypothetical protein
MLDLALKPVLLHNPMGEGGALHHGTENAFPVLITAYGRVWPLKSLSMLIVWLQFQFVNVTGVPSVHDHVRFVRSYSNPIHANAADPAEQTQLLEHACGGTTEYFMKSDSS